MKDWINTIRGKEADLELIASWASQVQFGIVRDAIRHAIYELRKEIERLEKLNEQKA